MSCAAAWMVVSGVHVTTRCFPSSAAVVESRSLPEASPLTADARCKIFGQSAPYQVPISDDPDEPAIVDDGEGAHTRLLHDHYRIPNRTMWLDRYARPAYPIDRPHKHSSRLAVGTRSSLLRVINNYVQRQGR